MTRQQWNQLREERPDLRLFCAEIFTPYYWDAHASNITPDELVGEITAMQLQGDPHHWGRDFFFGLEVK